MASPDRIAPFIDKMMEAGLDRTIIETVLDRTKAMTVAAIEYTLAEVLAEAKVPRLAAYVPDPWVGPPTASARAIISGIRTSLHPHVCEGCQRSAGPE